MSAVLLIALGVVALTIVVAAVILRLRRRHEDLRTELLLRNLAQARIRAQLDWALRAMLRAAAGPPLRRGNDDTGREMTRR